jgi:hypothetical protein
MIIRLTSKLAKKLSVVPIEALSTDADPFTDWTAHVFKVGRLQYILITNTHTLYSAVMPGGGITTGKKFLAAMSLHLAELLRHDGMEHVFQRSILPALVDVTFSRNNNRSITGSMNDLTFLAESYILDSDISLREVSQTLNQAPMSYLDGASPHKAFRLLTVGQDEQSS